MNTATIPISQTSPNESASPSAITDFQWTAFVDEISRRLDKDGSFTLMHSVLVELFHFDRPFFAELTRRAGEEFLPFTFAGEHCYPNGDPICVRFSRRE